MHTLNNITKEEIESGKLPLRDLLQNSLYYPSCGIDGGVIKDCNTLGRTFEINSFVYSDYTTGAEAFNTEQNTFLGYHILGSRSVKMHELIPNGWKKEYPPHINLDDYLRYKDRWKVFSIWTVYERDDNRGDEHGPKRFSLLYIGGEGVATYQALYWSNKTKPKALAIVQPGTGFGLNWTDFRSENGPLAWVVNNNPAGKPQIIYYGGYGNDYNDFNWEGYNEIRMIKPYYEDCSGEVRVLKNEKTE